MLPLPDKKYSIIYADPPWQQKKGNLRKCRPNQTKSLDYPTLSISEIQHILQSVQTETKCNLFVWTIDKFWRDTEDMLADIGYIIHARFIWDKTNGVAPAMTVRFSHEYLLWAYKKGNMLMPCANARGKYTTVFREASVRHSQKPQCAYEMLESMFPDSTRIELFSRRRRVGWDAWGNEIQTAQAGEDGHGNN